MELKLILTECDTIKVIKFVRKCVNLVCSLNTMAGIVNVYLRIIFRCIFITIGTWDMSSVYMFHCPLWKVRIIKTTF